MFSLVLGFFEFGAGEIMFIMLVALLLFGGDKLPQLARGLGKGIRDFKDASEGIKREINNQIDNLEEKKRTEAHAAEIEQVASGAGDEHPVAADEAPVVIEHPEDSMPVAEITSDDHVAPVKAGKTTTKRAHLKETPIAPVKNEHE